MSTRYVADPTPLTKQEQAHYAQLKKDLDPIYARLKEVSPGQEKTTQQQIQWFLERHPAVAEPKPSPSPEPDSPAPTNQAA